MKISVITINLNNANGLQKTIESVVAQTFDDFEYIIIDGASKDNSVEVIQQYAARISYWVSEPDKGIYNAMNKGITKATGQYCLFLNSGDWLHDDHSLQRLFSIPFTEEIVYTNCYFCKSMNGPLIEATFPNENELTFGFFIHDALCHQSQFIRRDLFDRHSMYDEQYKIFSDYKFVLTAIVHAKASYKYLPIFTSVYNHWGISATNNDLKEKERKEILLSEFPFFGKDYLQSDKERYELMAIRNQPIIRFAKNVKKALGR